MEDPGDDGILHWPSFPWHLALILMCADSIGCFYNEWHAIQDAEIVINKIHSATPPTSRSRRTRLRR